MTTHVGNFVIFGDIEQKWLAFGGLAGALRQPVSNEAPTFDNVGREQKFQGGFISWHPDAGVRAHVVWGLIGLRWSAIGREQFGYPVSDESEFPGGGKYNTFRALQYPGHPEASIVWKPGAAAAWEVYGAIRQSWIDTGSIVGPLHYPVDQERPAFDNIGRYQHFEGGILSWHPEIAGGPFIVWGLVGKRWLEIGREQFGYPISHEMTFPDGGKYSTFRAMHLAGHPEASIVWKPGTAAAWEVYGAIRQRWLAIGGPGGTLGYPVQEERPTTDGEGRYQLFERGSISWHPATDAREALYRPWAVILCRFKGAAPDPATEGPTEQFYRAAFTPGSGGLIEYWREASLGAIDITGSRIFGWIEVEIPRAGAGVGRVALANAAIKAVQQANGSNALAGYYGQIAIYTQNWTKDDSNQPPGTPSWTSDDPLKPWWPFWIDGGSTGGQMAVTLTPPHDGNISAHEMGHVFGMNHDVGADLDGDYMDPCCIMSQNNSFSHPVLHHAFGPAVCLPHLMQRDWMFKPRVYVDDGTWLSRAEGITLPLAPLGHTGAKANLGIKLSYRRGNDAWDYYLEYVQPTGWDRGLGKSYLMIRRMAPKYGGTPAYLGLVEIPTTGFHAQAGFTEPSGNVRFQVETTDLPGPMISVTAKRL
jgi:LGFP repeat